MLFPPSQLSGVFLLAAGMMWGGLSAAAPPTRTISELRELPNIAGLRVEARTKGVITYIGNENTDFAIQDETSAMWVISQADESTPLGLGQWIEIEGCVKKGNFAPDLVADSIRPIDGHKGLPDPMRVSGSELLTGVYDCRFVEVTGIVRAVLPWPSPGSQGVWLARGDGLEFG